MNIRYLLCSSCEAIAPLSSNIDALLFFDNHMHTEDKRHIVACVDHAFLSPPVQNKQVEQLSA